MTYPRATRIGFRGASLLGATAIAAAALAPMVASTSAQAWELRVCADPNALPFSHRDETGFENRIAEIIADDLGATLTYEWYPQINAMISQRLRTGQCDVIMGTAGNQGTVLGTLSYYRAPFVFVYRADEAYDIRTFDDPILADLDIGVQPAEGPTHRALMNRGLGRNIVQQFGFLGGDAEDPLEPAIEAVARGDLDVAVVWGPAAGYYADQQDAELVVQPVPPFEPPFIPMYINIGIGTRLGDQSLRDLLDIALVRRWDDIQAVIDSYGIPTMPLPKPTLTLEETAQ